MLSAALESASTFIYIIQFLISMQVIPILYCSLAVEQTSYNCINLFFFFGGGEGEHSSSFRICPSENALSYTAMSRAPCS
jgi:hypothetical protein